MTVILSMSAQKKNPRRTDIFGQLYISRMITDRKRPVQIQVVVFDCTQQKVGFWLDAVTAFLTLMRTNIYFSDLNTPFK